VNAIIKLLVIVLLLFIILSEALPYLVVLAIWPLTTVG
jgi:hypothetical protein